MCGRLLLCSLCLSATTYAQELPNPQPGKPHQIFAQDAGTWDCNVKMFFQGPQGPPAEFQGVEVNKALCGGLYAQSSFTLPMGERTFEGHGLMGFDPRTSEYEGTWVDNFTSVPSTLKGTFDESGKTMTLHSSVVDPAGNELKQKQVTTWLDASHKKFEIFLVLDQGGQNLDIKLMEMTSKKRP